MMRTFSDFPPGDNRRFLFRFTLYAAILSFLLPVSGCRRKKVDEILSVKNLIVRWENGIILNSPDSLAAVFSSKKDWIVKKPEEMDRFVFSSEIKHIRVAGRTIKLYREDDQIKSAEVDLDLSGRKIIQPDSSQTWKGHLHLLLRKHKDKWGIVDYKFE